MIQLDSIYIFCDNKSNDTAWTKDWSKVKGVFTQIELLCDSLKRDTRQCENDLTSIRFASSTNTVSNELNQSFMYSQILKEILLDMDHNNKEKREFVKFCREQYVGNKAELRVIDEFERYYPRPSSTEKFGEDPSPIWWYTRHCFIYSMLNKALRIQDIEIILKMGFFMQDIHRQIEQLHSLSTKRESFIVYRGQCMSNSEFEEMRNNQGGLLSFNNFLSTSTDRNVALYFAESGRKNPDVTCVLFRMLIDPSSLFASLDENVSFFKKTEKEILFSMHTVFRIGEMKQSAGRLWEVELKLTRDDDEQLKTLTNHMRKEIGVGTGWDRLGSLLVKMGELDKAEDIYTTLLDLTRDDDWKMLAHINNQLGYIIKQKGDLATALTFYQATLEIQQNFLPPTHQDLAITYSNIGSVHDSMGDYSTALIFYRKTLEIKQKTLPSDHSSFATTYNNIGLVHDMMGDYSRALSFYQKTLEIQEKSCPSNHPSIATTYNNIGKVHRSMEDYPSALSFYQRACEIFQRSLPSNHPSLALIYNNIGIVHDAMGDYSTALSFYQKTLEIKEKSLPSNHPSLATTYNNIGFAHKSMGHYSTALSFYQKALDIAQRSLPASHQDIEDLKDQIALVRKKL
jgi:tetratricopeptide (TPR) repeat protein